VPPAATVPVSSRALPLVLRDLGVPRTRWQVRNHRAAQQETPLAYETILYEEDGPVGTLTLNRPDDGNMFTAVMCHEVRDCIDAIRRETRTRVLVLTGAGDRFFCIGGRKKKAKEIWFRNPRLSAREALELGMINTVVPDDQLKQATRAIALEIAERGAFALAAIKTAFSARHGGVGGLARLAHDLLLRQ